MKIGREIVLRISQDFDDGLASVEIQMDILWTAFFAGEYAPQPPIDCLSCWHWQALEHFGVKKIVVLPEI